MDVQAHLEYQFLEYSRMLQRHWLDLARNKRDRLRLALFASMAIAASTLHPHRSFGQGGPQSQAPAFEDQSFRDKVWEAGGPKFNSSKTGKLILSVTIVGRKTISEHEILRHMQCRANRVFDSEQFNHDLHELYNTDLFNKIEPFFSETPEGIHLKLKVYENPIVQSVVFHGNTRLDDSQLKKHVGIEKGDPINPASVKQAESRALDLYRDKGFSNASVKLHSGTKPGENDVVFRISEGELERIDKIRFVGNSEFSSEILKTNSDLVRLALISGLGLRAPTQRVQKKKRLGLGLG